MSLIDRIYDGVRHPLAQTAAVPFPAYGDFDGLAAFRYCLVVTFRRDGRPVPTPVWFALEEDLAFVRTDAASAKVARIRRDPRALVAGCSARGKPLGPSLSAEARILEAEESARAEWLLARRYGPARRMYRWIAPATEPAYIELRPAASSPG
jgi:PPOX class probable F420-dependent enzyme